MSHAAALSVPSALQEEFLKATDDATTRFLQVHIRNEEMALASSGQASDTESSDFDVMQHKAAPKEASYFLFRPGQPPQKAWLLVTYVPEGVPIRSRMLYASAKATLKEKLGARFFVDEYHATSKEELSYAAFKGHSRPLDARSSGERALDEMHKMEAAARVEQTKPPASGIGGYHTVNIPLSAQASAALASLRDGDVNFVELRITDSKDSIVADAATVASLKEAEAKMNTTEPRFYVFKRTPPTPGQPVFVYCCPDASPGKLRMVYSTAKPSVVEQITKAGVSLAPKKVELRSPVELADELSPQPPRQTAAAASPGQATRAAPPKVGGAQHPVYALMGGGLEGTSTKKKIVMPPKGAW